MNRSFSKASVSFDIMDEFACQTLGEYNTLTNFDEWKTNYINEIQLIPMRDNYEELVFYLSVIKEYDDGQFNEWSNPQRIFEKAMNYMFIETLGNLTYEELLEWINIHNPNLNDRTEYLVEAQEEEDDEETDGEQETDEEEED